MTSGRRKNTAPAARDGDAEDRRWMQEALVEAALGLGRTSPNPAVGCILVRNGKEISRGHYRGDAGSHAEAVALARAAAQASAGVVAKGATAYVTLEPHAHQGRTPPCTDALLAAGVTRVVVGCVDPNALVAGRGVRQLRRAGCEVVCGVLESECLEMIRGFRRVIGGHGPFVHVKMAASLDGRIAASSGDAEWISSPPSRAMVQAMRLRAEAIVVGIGTVLADDPRLTCRLAGAPSPLRVVLDPELRTPPTARLLRGRGGALIFGAADAPAARRRKLERVGATVECFDTRGRRGWQRVLKALAARGIMEVLVEGGGAVVASAIRAGVVDRLSIFYNPRLLGSDGVPMAGPLGVRRASQGPRFRTLSLRHVGEDILWEGEPK